MELTAGWFLATSVSLNGSNNTLIIVLAVAVVIIAVLLVQTSLQKRRTEQAAARIVSMSEEMLNLSSVPISRNEIGGYRLEEKLFESVGSVTYRGVDKSNQPCDIKIPTTSALEDKMTMARLEREARVLEGIDSPHVVRYRAFEKVRDRGRVVPLLVTEVMEGEELTDVVKREAPMDWQRVVAILEDLAGALAAVHRNEVVHRNVKPSSVKITRSGRAVLYNFGVAQADDAQQLTQRGDVLGTGLYLSPEAIMGKSLDGRSDLYSLGVTAFEMLTGRPPHAGSTFAELVMKKMQDEVPHPGLVTPGVPQEIDALVARLMEKDANKRPHSAGLLLTELQSISRTLRSESMN